VETRDAGRRRGPRRHSRDPSARRSRKIHRPTPGASLPSATTPVREYPRLRPPLVQRDVIRRFTPVRSLLPSFVPSDAAVTSLLLLVISLLTLLSFYCLRLFRTTDLPRFFPIASFYRILYFIPYRSCPTWKPHGFLIAPSSFIQRTLTRWKQPTVIFHVTHERWITPSSGDSKLARRQVSARRIRVESSISD